MNTRIRSTAVLFAAALAAAACGKKDEPAAGSELAVVNGKPISEQVFNLYLERRTGGGQFELGEDQRRELLEQVINIELLAQDAVNAKLDQEARVAGELAIQRTTLLAQAAIRHHLEMNPISDEALKAEYEKRLPELAQKEYKARHILLRSEEEAREVIRALDKGADFTKLARTRSIEPGAAQSGGELGWFSPNRMVKPFADAVVALEPGKYSKEPVQTQFGWHVVLSEGSRDVPAPSFEEMREQLRGALQNQAIEAYINQLRGAAKIDIRQPAPETAVQPEKPTDS